MITELEPTRWPPGFWDAFAPDPDFEVPSPLPSSAVDLDDPDGPARVPDNERRTGPDPGGP